MIFITLLPANNVFAGSNGVAVTIKRIDNNKKQSTFTFEVVQDRYIPEYAKDCKNITLLVKYNKLQYYKEKYIKNTNRIYPTEKKNNENIKLLSNMNMSNIVYLENFGEPYIQIEKCRYKTYAIELTIDRNGNIVAIIPMMRSF